MFDIQRTLQETYDYNRRRLFQEENMPPDDPCEQSLLNSSTEDTGSSDEGDISDGELSENTDSFLCSKVRIKLSPQ